MLTMEKVVIFMNYNEKNYTSRRRGLVIIWAAWAFFGKLGMVWSSSGQATSKGITVKAVAEVRVETAQGGVVGTRLTPATRVVPGDEVVYTLEVRNTGTTALREPTITQPVPAHMAYVADSATGPGAEVSYSVDGGHSFAPSEDLRVMGEDGRMRMAVASDYTHIQWKLKNPLKSNSMAFIRFRAVVK